MRNLNTKDIGGAQANTKSKGAFANIERRQVRPVNDTKDIAGGQADTLKRGAGSDRHINPLNPFYQYPGGTENINLQNDPFGVTTCSMGPANFA